MIDLPTIAFINEVEDCYAMPDSSPSLGTAFQLLQARWAANCRDRETALRLAFLAWYTDAEATWLTGLPEDPLPSPFFAEAFEALGGADCTDPEACFVIGVMAQMIPWCCGNDIHWQTTGESFITRVCALSPHGLPADIFDGRGAYGQYFAQMAAPFKRT